MLFFVIELDEDKIKKDRLIDLEKAYESIDKTFAQKDVTLYATNGATRFYTRDIDEHDFEYLWMVNSPFKKCSWFLYYVKTWRFLDIDDNDTKQIYEDEDVMETWVKVRPEKP